MSGTTFARGVSKVIVMGEETSFGVASPAAGQNLRRTSGNIDLNISAIQGQEILTSQQVRDWRQGPRQVSGTIAGQLSPATYKMFFEGLLGGRFTPGAYVTVADFGFSVGADTEQVVGSSPIALANMTSAQASWHNAGFKLGDVVSIGGLEGNEAVYNGVTMNIVGWGAQGGALDVSTRSAIGAITSGTQPSVTITVAGKKLIAPTAGQLDLSYTFEQYYADIQTSELFTGCKITSISINVPPSGFVTFSASITGQQGKPTQDTAPYFSGGAAETGTESLTAVSGAICYNGVALTYLTSLNMQIQSDVQADPVIGSNIIPAIFKGTLSVRGTLTCFMTDDSLTNDFLTEKEVQIILYLTSPDQNNPNTGTTFINFFLPRVKLASATKTDSDRAIVRSYSFVALENVNPNAIFTDNTTITIIDSDA